MPDITLGAVETKFAEIVWENEPLSSGELVKLCQEKLEWKKSTTYTVLKKLCTKGILKNEKGIVTALIKKDDFYSFQSRQFIDENFGGSLPAFLIAFVKKQKLSEKETEEIRKMIDSM